MKSKNFHGQLEEIGELYEKGKDCLNSLSILESERNDYSQVFEILKELRDLAATHLKLYWSATPNSDSSKIKTTEGGWEIDELIKHFERGKKDGYKYVKISYQAPLHIEYIVPFIQLVEEKPR